jgi:hypothetical protein
MAASDAQREPGRVRRIFSGSREIVRVVYRDPEHVAERITLLLSDRLGASSRTWADAAREAHPDKPQAVIAEDLRQRSVRIARVDGAISGTPFFIALVPGYLTFLLQEMRMTLRTAALYDRDPGAMQTAAEMLALRGIHPDPASALAALERVSAAPMPDRVTERRSLRTWYRSGVLLLVFGGFMRMPEEHTGWRDWVNTAIATVVGTVIWIVTWILPLTFMMMMAWACESHARHLGRSTLVYYGGEEATVEAALAAAERKHDPHRRRRTLVRGVLLALTVVLPLGFVAYTIAVDHALGFSPFGALGSLVALSLVIATAVVSSRG